MGMFHQHKLTLFGRACAIIFVEVVQCSLILFSLLRTSH